MINVTKPVKCPYCGNDIITYSTDTETNQLLFSCTCGHTLNLTEDMYMELLKTGKYSSK